ncbi:MAG: PIN domain-containing protein [Microlunatus sp.]
MTDFLPDTNIWLALTLDWHPAHSPARRWWERLSDIDRVVMCRPVQLSTLRLLTTRAVFTAGGVEPLTNTQAWAVMDEIVADRRVECRVLEPRGTEELWRAASDISSSSPKMWMDAYLSGWARAAGATLVTSDHALARAHNGAAVLL